MTARKFIRPALAAGVLGALGFAAYATHDRWVPVVFPRPAAGPDGSDHAGHDHPVKDRLKLSPQAQANLGLDVDALAPEAYWRTVLIPGSVAERPGESDRGVAARVAGLVTDVKARPGDTVKAGDPLFSVHVVSELAHAAQADLAKAVQELRIATTRRDRLAGQEGAVSEAARVEAENQVTRATAQVRTVRRQLEALGFTPAQVEAAERGEVVTEVVVSVPARPKPAAGDSPTADRPADVLFEVEELKVQLGEHVQAGQVLCLLGNHQRLFVEGRAFKSEAPALARAAEQGVPVRAEFADEAPGDWPVQAPLTIHHLSNQVDPATRTFSFYLPLDNLSRTFEKDGKPLFVWRYRPGQRVRLRVPVEKLGDDVFVLPAAAVVREGPEAFAFVQNGDLFVRKPVRVLFENRTEVVLANDGSVSPGQFVVRNQAAALNRALKAAAGGGKDDDHDH